MVRLPSLSTPTDTPSHYTTLTRSPVPRLVGQYQLGIERASAGDPDAPGLAAGKLVRVALTELGWQADKAQQPPAFRVQVAPLQVVDVVELGDQLPHGEARD